MKKYLDNREPDQISLLLRICNGDQMAFAELFYSYYDKLYGFILRISRSHQKAEDITQDVFLKIWQKREEIVTTQNINALLFKMAQNQVIDLLRKQIREESTLSVLFENEKQSLILQPLDILLHGELQAKIAEAIEQLPSQQKKVFKLYKEEGIRQDEIARKLNLSLSTIQSHVKLAVTNIHKYLTLKYPDLLVGILLITGFN